MRHAITDTYTTSKPHGLSSAQLLKGFFDSKTPIQENSLLGALQLLYLVGVQSLWEQFRFVRHFVLL
jgi:hypothetical protein